jgi:PST family polysaccharide transporter
MASARRLAANLFSGVFSNIIRICLQIVMLPLMAKLLGPAELGLYALALPILSFVLLLAEAGLGDSLAREKSDDPLVWSSAFWGLMGAATVMAVGVCVASFIIGKVAHQPRLPEIMIPLSLTLFMVGASIIPSARMLREGNLTPGTIADFFANLLGAAVALYMAFNGYGVWAMVAQVLTTSFVRMILLNVLKPMLPRFVFSLKALMSHSGVGGAILGQRLIETCGQMIERSRVSRGMPSADLGYYGYANQIGRFFSDAVSNPMWQNLYYVAINKEADEIKRHYVMSHRIFSLIVFPGAVLLALALPTLVPMVLGDKWVASTFPIMIMVLSCPFIALGTYHGAVMFAQRRYRIMLLGYTGLVLARIAVVVGGIRFGVTGLTVGLSVVNVLFYAYAVVYVSPKVGVRRTDVFTAIVGPFIASVLTGVVFYYLHSLLPHGLAGMPGPAWMPALAWLVVSGGLSLLAYPAALFLFDRRRTQNDVTAAMAIVQKRKITA